VNELNNSYPELARTVRVGDLANKFFSKEWKTAVGGNKANVKYSVILFQMLKSNPNVYKNILMNIIKTADNGTDRHNAYA
jgi:hypothetical protein